MDPERARILADLGGLLEGQVRCDDPFLNLYSTDASLYQAKPLAVVRPTGVEDVVRCVKYARENNFPLIPRGSGSNVIGGVVGSGIIMEFVSSMRRVVEVAEDHVVVQPGVVLSELNRQIAPLTGRTFSPDPSTRTVATIGGMIGMNRYGSHWIETGETRDKILQLQVVNSEGEVLTIDANRPWPGNSQRPAKLPSPTVSHLTSRVSNIVSRNEELLAGARPQTRVNQAGYNLFDIQHAAAEDSSLDLTRLICGSEGTLGIVTQATLALDDIQLHRGVAMLFFHSLDTAAATGIEIVKTGVSACDMLDRRLLSLARETNQMFQRMIPADAEAMLLVEVCAENDAALRDRLKKLTDRFERKRKHAFDCRVATGQSERDQYWHIVRRVVPTLYRLRGFRRAVPFVEDLSIDPAKLPSFLKSIHRVLNEHEVTASIFSHVPQGTVHVRPFLTMSDKASVAKMVPVAKAIFDETIAIGGSISGSHGDGLSRTWYLRSQYGKLHSVFAEIKNVFDPGNLFNPGKIVGLPYSGLTDNLRELRVAQVVADGQLTETDIEPEEETASSPEPVASDVQPTPQDLTPAPRPSWFRPNSAVSSSGLPVIQPELAWSIDELSVTARNCNGCGRCKTTMPNQRMCPVYRVLPVEEASPRAKANLMRGIVTGQLDPSSLARDELKSIADLCVNCHQCRFECPAMVDIPKLMTEAKAQYFENNGLKISDWVLTRLDWLYEIGGRLPWLTNKITSGAVPRWLLDRLLGIAQGRKLPRFATGTLMRWAQREQLTRPSKQPTRKVVYFVDAFANWNDVQLGRAFVEVLRHNNIEVVIPPGQAVSGMSLVSEGAVGRARRIATRNVDLLSEWVRQGYQVVTTEPSAALAIKHEYLNLLDEPEAQKVADQTIDSTAFLIGLHRSGELALDFRPVNAHVGYHLPCHQRALLVDGNVDSIPAIQLMNLIPGLKVEYLDRGCSGMAGTYGLKKRNYRRSLKMGLPLIQSLRDPLILAGSTECSTCKIQMEQGTSKPTIHPIKLLALAYGVMPELNDLLNRRSGVRNLS